VVNEGVEKKKKKEKKREARNKNQFWNKNL
jgi:hypothetical protein